MRHNFTSFRITRSVPIRTRLTCSFKSAWDAVASPFGTPASAHPPSLARGKERYRLSRWHPSGSRPGIATIFRIAQATRSTGGDAWDQLSPKPSGDEKTRSFGEDARPRWSTSAGSGSLRDQVVGGRCLRVGSRGLLERGQTTKRGVEPCAPNPGM
jgi:hypothetical protein